MIRKLVKSFVDFFKGAPYFGILGLLALFIVTCRWYYETVKSDPRLQHIVVGAEEGLSVDSVFKLEWYMYHSPGVETDDSVSHAVDY